jgi:methylthioribose-1-phosphate isomerase
MSEYPTIRWNSAAGCLEVIDQRVLPHKVVIEEIRDIESATEAIRDMHVRGAPLIGAVAAFGAHFALELVIEGIRDREWLTAAVRELRDARPTAVNLNWAVDEVLEAARTAPEASAIATVTLSTANRIVEDELERSRLIGEAGLALLKELSDQKGDQPVNVLTHCNAGRLACIDFGTATAPVYLAADRGLDVHVWVDETRPRNQGARLTAWELSEKGVPYTVVTDNTGGHLMQQGLVDIVIVGTDRTTRNGDVVNKIGTYLKALAAKDNNVPFYVAAPSSSIDWGLASGSDVPIELRNQDEVHRVWGEVDGNVTSVRITPEDAQASNYAFDVTPARLVTGLITERGVCSPGELSTMFPEAQNG